MDGDFQRGESGISFNRPAPSSSGSPKGFDKSPQLAEIDRELEQLLKKQQSKVKVFGVGGGGGNTVSRMKEIGIKGGEFIAVNTDAQDLLYANSDNKILIGKELTMGLGAGSNPKIGEEAAHESEQDIKKALSGSDMVFITCGLGGGTGTGSAPILAEVARNAGALTIAVVTLPFSDEGVIRKQNAQKGLEVLAKNVDTVIVVQNDRLLDLVPDLPLNAAFKVADEILVNAVKGITELVTEKGLVNLDFADVRTIMQNGGVAMIGLGESDSEFNAEEAADKALQNPLLDVDITGAKSALINIAGGQDMSLKSAKTVMKTVAERLDPSARIIWGARLDESMDKSLRVMLIVTSLQIDDNSDYPRLRQKESAATFKTPKLNEEEVVHVDGDGVGEVFEADINEAISTHKSKGKVFSEIFFEECGADIDLFEDAIQNLEPGVEDSNTRPLRDIKNACSSLRGSADLFSNKQVARLAKVVGDVAEHAAMDEFELTEDLLDLFAQTPSILRSMMTDDEAGYNDARILIQDFGNIVNNPLQLLRRLAYRDKLKNIVQYPDSAGYKIYRILTVKLSFTPGPGSKKTVANGLRVEVGKTLLR